MEKSVGVSPITVMFAVFAGGELFGYFVQPYIVRMQTREAAEPVVQAEPSSST